MAEAVFEETIKVFACPDVRVNVNSELVGLYVGDTETALDGKEVRKLRKALKRALKTGQVLDSLL